MRLERRVQRIEQWEAPSTAYVVLHARDGDEDLVAREYRAKTGDATSLVIVLRKFQVDAVSSWEPVSRGFCSMASGRSRY